MKVEGEKGTGQGLPVVAADGEKGGDCCEVLSACPSASQRQLAGLLMNLTLAPDELSSPHSSRRLSPMSSTARHCEICRVVAK